MFVYVCVSMFTCDRVLQRGGLAARAWTRRDLFIPLTSDKAEALLVMMWLLLPIMPHCRPGHKTVRCTLRVPHQLPVESCTLLLFYEDFITLFRHFQTHLWAWFHEIIPSKMALYVFLPLSCLDCLTFGIYMVLFCVVQQRIMYFWSLKVIVSCFW